jgi:hypothetical protein
MIGDLDGLERRNAAGGSTPKIHRRRQTATPANAPTALVASHGVRDRRFAVLDSRGDRERGVRGSSSSTAADSYSAATEAALLGSTSAA